jgi:hypothetical protein
VQIGGGVRVGDAFQAIVGSKPIAIWERWFCVEISQSEAFASRLLQQQERYAPASRNRAESEASEQVETNGLNEAASQLNEFAFR